MHVLSYTQPEPRTTRQPNDGTSSAICLNCITEYLKWSIAHQNECYSSKKNNVYYHNANWHSSLVSDKVNQRPETMNAVLQNYETLMYTLVVVREEQQEFEITKVWNAFPSSSGLLRIWRIRRGIECPSRKLFALQSTTLKKQVKQQDTCGLWSVNAVLKNLMNHTINASLRLQNTASKSVHLRDIDDDLGSRWLNKSHNFQTPRSYFRQKYYEVIDKIILQLDHRFGQKALNSGHRTNTAGCCERRQICDTKGCPSKLRGGHLMRKGWCTRYIFFTTSLWPENCKSWK